MLGKFAEAKKKMEEIRKRLDNITVTGESEGGKIVVEATGTNRIKSIHINDSLFKIGQREEIEELLTVAMNRALESSEKLMQSEIAAVSNDILPGFLRS